MMGLSMKKRARDEEKYPKVLTHMQLKYSTGKCVGRSEGVDGTLVPTDKDRTKPYFIL